MKLKPSETQSKNHGDKITGAEAHGEVVRKVRAHFRACGQLFRADVEKQAG